MFSRIRNTWRILRGERLRSYWVVFTASQTYSFVGEDEPPRIEGEIARIKCFGKLPTFRRVVAVSHD